MSLSTRSTIKGKDFSRVASNHKLKGKIDKTPSKLNLGYKRFSRRTRRESSNKKIILYKYLPLTCIELPYNLTWKEEDHPFPVVPPTTPRSDQFRFDFRYQRLPRVLLDLSTLEIPLIRECGIKRCIEELALYFGCTEYKFNYLQFWFLDILTDCIWRAQDRYEFPPDQQKIILSWILFALDIIGDLKHSYTQREFFAIFKESIIAAAVVLEEGSNEILLPLKLIKIRRGHDSDILEENEMDESSSREKTCTIETSSTKVSTCAEDSKSGDIMDYESVYEIHLGRDKLQVVLDHEVCECSNYGESLSAHKEVESENVEPPDLDWMEYEEEEMLEESEIMDDWDYRDFYKPSSRTPSRFLQSSSDETTEVTETLQKETDISLANLGSLSKLTFLRLPGGTNTSNINIVDKLNNYIIFRKISFSSVVDTEVLDVAEALEVPEEAEVNKEQPESSTSIKEEAETQEHQIEKIMKGLKKLKLIEQRMRDLSDPNVGLADWQVETPPEEITKEPSVKEDACINEQILKEKIDTSVNIEELNDNELMSFAILWSIIDFVYEYFSDSFQYSLIKNALTVTPNVFTQVINNVYHVPKKISEDLTTVVPDLKEKNKKFVRKLEISKSFLVAKKGKDKDTKETKDTKKSKESEKGKKDKPDKPDKPDKLDKHDKQDKKDKSKSKEIPKFTKEELLNLQMLEQAEALKLKRERDKAFMFPLTEAVNDRFFSKKFPNWSKFESWASKGPVEKKKK